MTTREIFIHCQAWFSGGRPLVSLLMEWMNMTLINMFWCISGNAVMKMYTGAVKGRDRNG